MKNITFDFVFYTLKVIRVRKIYNKDLDNISKTKKEINQIYNFLNKLEKEFNFTMTIKWVIKNENYKYGS